MTKTWCVGGLHLSNTNNKIGYKKINPKTKKLVKIIKGTCSICGRNKSQTSTNYMIRAENFIKNAKCTHGHRSVMSNSAWCELNKNCTVLKIHDMCHNPKCNCQKQITFTLRQFQLEGGSIKSKPQKIFKGTQTPWNKFPKPVLNVAAPFIGMAVSAKTKNPKVGQATTKILKSISGGEIKGLADMHSHGLKLKVK